MNTYSPAIFESERILWSFQTTRRSQNLFNSRGFDKSTRFIHCLQLIILPAWCILCLRRRIL